MDKQQREALRGMAEQLLQQATANVELLQRCLRAVKAATERIRAQDAEIARLKASQNDLRQELEARGGDVPECYFRLLKHARGMTFGVNWDSGTAAGYHRTKLIQAVKDCCAQRAQRAQRAQQGKENSDE